MFYIVCFFAGRALCEVVKRYLFLGVGVHHHTTSHVHAAWPGRLLAAQCRPSLQPQHTHTHTLTHTHTHTHSGTGYKTTGTGKTAFDDCYVPAGYGSSKTEAGWVATPCPADTYGSNANIFGVRTIICTSW